MDFIFEPAIPDDLDEIMRIEDESFTPEIREERRVFQERLDTFPGGHFVLVRDRAARDTALRALAGYFSSEIWAEVPPALAAEWKLGHSARERHAPRGTVLYVSSFAVERASRHTEAKNAAERGAGSVLFGLSLDAIISRHPAIRTITFVVHEDWAAARHIYEKAGFSYSGRIDGFFTAHAGPSAAALIMKKDI